MSRKVVESSIPGFLIYVCTDCGNALGLINNPEDSCDVCDEKDAANG
jgi:rubrerythrin